MRALEICPLTLPSWKRNVNDRGLERALAILSMRSYAIGRLHDFASEPFSAGFRTNLCGKHRNGSTQKAPRQQTFKFEEVRGRHHREARLCSLISLFEASSVLPSRQTGVRGQQINTTSKPGLPSNTLLRNHHGKIRESSQTAGTITSHKQGSKQQTETTKEHGDLANRGGL
jgi:hypothetical protein